MGVGFDGFGLVSFSVFFCVIGVCENVCVECYAFALVLMMKLIAIWK